jgi:hypothetical protein
MTFCDLEMSKLRYSETILHFMFSTGVPKKEDESIAPLFIGGF